jgi:hypothetical protein
MLHDIIASTSTGDTILEWFEYAALAIEILAVVIIVVAIFYATNAIRSRSLSTGTT